MLTQLLTLDPTTLFYWSLVSEHPSKRMKYSVESWAKTIPSKATSGSSASRPTSHANSARTGKASSTGRRPGSTAPALISSRSQADSSASILTGAITITNAQVPEAVKIKQDTAIYTYDGALSDNDEIMGVERDAAHASPFKGKKRLNSEVSGLSLI